MRQNRHWGRRLAALALTAALTGSAAPALAAGDYWDVYYRLLEAIRPAFARHGVEMPYSQLDVHLIPRSPQD